MSSHIQRLDSGHDSSEFSFSCRPFLKFTWARGRLVRLSRASHNHLTKHLVCVTTSAVDGCQRRACNESTSFHIFFLPLIKKKSFWSLPRGMPVSICSGSAHAQMKYAYISQVLFCLSSERDKLWSRRPCVFLAASASICLCPYLEDNVSTGSEKISLS